MTVIKNRLKGVTEKNSPENIGDTMSTEQTTTKSFTKKEDAKGVLKKVSADQIKLSDKPAGFRLTGLYVGISTRERANDEGEIKTLHTMVIEHKTTGVRTKFLADAGLRMALEDAMIQKGDYFEAVKCEKINIGSGRTMNTWDIFQFSDDN